MHPRYLSNAYVVGDKRGGTAVFVDSGAPLTPLLPFVGQHGLTPTHVLRTHSHADHVEHEEELDLPVVNSVVRDRRPARSRRSRRPATPTTWSASSSATRSGEEYVFSGDTLFKNSIGGGNFEQIKTRRDGRLHGDAADAPA